MKLFLSVAVLSFAALAASVQEISRDEIRRAAVPGSGTMEVIVAKQKVPPGAKIPLHTHPGDENTVVLTSTSAKVSNGNVLEFPVGTPLYFPDKEVHRGLTNVGGTDMVAITTHIVRKGRTLQRACELI